MRIAGVWLETGRMVWVNTGDLDLQVFDSVVVDLPEGQVSGRVHVSAAQWLSPPVRVDGVVLRITPDTPTLADDRVPGQNMPMLGTNVRYGAVGGLVTAIDPVGRTVTLTSDAGDEMVIQSG